MTVAVRRRLWPKSLAGKALAVFIFAVLLLALLWVVALLAAERRLAAAWAAGEAIGYSSRLEDLLPNHLPPEDNAAFALARASARSSDLLLEWETRANIAVTDLYRQPFLPLVINLLDDPIFEIHLKLADATPGYTPLDDPKATDIDVRRQLVAVKDLVHAENLLAWHLADQGRFDEAVHRLVRALRLTRRWADKETTFSGFSSSYFVRSEYIRLLNEFVRRRGRLTWRTANAVEHELQHHENSIVLLPILAHRQKFIELNSYEDFFPWSRLLAVRPFTRAEQASIIEHLNSGMHCVAIPYTVVKVEMDSMKREEKELREGKLPGLQRGKINALSSIHWTRFWMDRLTAEVRCLRIVVAMAKWGAFDGELDSLGLPPDSLVDPFDGGRLLVKSTPKGPIIYSVSSNLADDAGDFNQGIDVGLGPAQRRISD